MKNTKVCPKCHSENIVRYDEFFGQSASNQGTFLRTSMFSGVNLRIYVCCNCGYSEIWVDEEDLEKVKASKNAQKI
ncbi:MAG TPA: hypothetical protein PKO28_04525 [Bacilli bacterium]|nr:hypothetical protein [Bacilli bacterium]